MKLFVFAVLLAGLVAVSLAKEPPVAVVAELANNPINSESSSTTLDSTESITTGDGSESTTTGGGGESTTTGGGDESTTTGDGGESTTTGDGSGSSNTPTTNMPTTTDGAESLASGKIFGILVLALATKLLAA